MYLSPGVNILIDGQWGSTGKGKLGGWLGSKEKLACAVSSFGPNAGHTYSADDGTEVVFKIMPMSAYTAKCPVLIAPDSVFELERFHTERELLPDVPVYVHPLASVLEKQDREAAAITGRRIAGTMQGTGHAISRKLLRVEGVRLAKDVLPADYILDTTAYIRDCVQRGQKVLFEMSQGFDLSLNHGTDYPYVTSRDITVGTCLNSAGIPPSMLGQVIGCIRTFPIRVGNIDGGWSGPCYNDQTELTWQAVADISGGPEGLVEHTTVTKRVRRVFSFSVQQLQRFIAFNDPDALFVNFIQYLDWNMNGARTKGGITEAGQNLIRLIEDVSGVRVIAVGTGANNEDVVEL